MQALLVFFILFTVKFIVNLRPVSPPPTYGGLTQPVIGSTERRLAVAALVAKLVSTPSLCRVRIKFAHILYIHIAIRVCHKFVPLLSIRTLHLCIFQLQYIPRTARLFDSIQPPRAIQPLFILSSLQLRTLF